MISNETFDNTKKIHFSLVKPNCLTKFISCDDAIFQTKMQMFIFWHEDGVVEYTHLTQIVEMQVYKGDTVIRYV